MKLRLRDEGRVGGLVDGILLALRCYAAYLCVSVPVLICSLSQGGLHWWPAPCSVQSLAQPLTKATRSLTSQLFGDKHQGWMAVSSPSLPPLGFK